MGKCTQRQISYFVAEKLFRLMSLAKCWHRCVCRSFQSEPLDELYLQCAWHIHVPNVKHFCHAVYPCLAGGLGDFEVALGYIQKSVKIINVYCWHTFISVSSGASTSTHVGKCNGVHE